MSRPSGDSCLTYPSITKAWRSDSTSLMNFVIRARSAKPHVRFGQQGDITRSFGQEASIKVTSSGGCEATLGSRTTSSPQTGRTISSSRSRRRGSIPLRMVIRQNCTEDVECHAPQILFQLNDE